MQAAWQPGRPESSFDPMVRKTFIFCPRFFALIQSIRRRKRVP
jgi:hypothetical protein